MQPAGSNQKPFPEVILLIVLPVSRCYHRYKRMKQIQAISPQTFSCNTACANQDWIKDKTNQETSIWSRKESKQPITKHYHIMAMKTPTKWTKNQYLISQVSLHSLRIHLYFSIITLCVFRQTACLCNSCRRRTQSHDALLFLIGQTPQIAICKA